MHETQQEFHSSHAGSQFQEAAVPRKKGFTEFWQQQMSINELEVSYKPVQHSSTTHGTEETCQAISLIETLQNPARVQEQLKSQISYSIHAVPRQGLGQSAVSGS